MAAPTDLISLPSINAATGGVFFDNGSITSDGAGNFKTSGSVSAGSGVVFGGNGPLTVVGGLVYDEISGSIPATTATQALASGGTITLTGSGRIIRISCSDTSETTLKVTPTASSLTGTSNFANGVEVTVVNVSASATNAVIPGASLGAGGFSSAVSISAGCAVRLVYVADIGWVHLN